MKTRAFLVPLSAMVLLLMANAVALDDTSRIDAVICDLKTGENRFDSFCMITLPANSSSEPLELSTDYDVEPVDDKLRLQKSGKAVRINWNGTGKDGSPVRIVLRLRGRIYNHTLKLPLLAFPYPVDNTLIAVSAPGKKFVWNPGYGAYSPGDENPEKVVAAESFREEDVSLLNSEYLHLRSVTTKSLSMPEYRLYIGAISPGDDPGVGFWAGTVYDYYAWQTILAAVFSTAGLLLVYLYTRRRRQRTVDGEANGDGGTGREKNEKWEKVLGHLEGEEYTVYREILDAGGEMLQKKICDKTGFTSVKTTRILDRLEQKNLVERMSYGVTNKVILK